MFLIKTIICMFFLLLNYLQIMNGTRLNYKTRIYNIQNREKPSKSSHPIYFAVAVYNTTEPYFNKIKNNTIGKFKIYKDINQLDIKYSTLLQIFAIQIIEIIKETLFCYPEQEKYMEIESKFIKLNIEKVLQCSHAIKYLEIINANCNKIKILEEKFLSSDELLRKHIIVGIWIIYNILETGEKKINELVEILYDSIAIDRSQNMLAICPNYSMLNQPNKKVDNEFIELSFFNTNMFLENIKTIENMIKRSKKTKMVIITLQFDVILYLMTKIETNSIKNENFDVWENVYTSVINDLKRLRYNYEILNNLKIILQKYGIELTSEKLICFDEIDIKILFKFFWVPYLGDYNKNVVDILCLKIFEGLNIFFDCFKNHKIFNTKNIDKFIEMLEYKKPSAIYTKDRIPNFNLYENNADKKEIYAMKEQMEKYLDTKFLYRKFSLYTIDEE